MVTLPDHIHFIGGCGRAMSGVMVAVAELGVRVTGSDDEHTYGSARHWLAKLSSGRSALEAMASGCAVLPISRSSCLDLVDPDNFDLFQNHNFSPRLNTGQFNAASIVNAISSYDPARITALTAAVRSKCTLDAATDALESLYVRTVEDFSEQYPIPSAGFKDELHALANYIQSVMPMVRDRERLLMENHDIQQVIAVKEQTITALLGCNSMRITRPIRVFSNLLRRLGRAKTKPSGSLTT